jgi:hypothetical protein
VAELYEVWCFLQVRNILIELGFNEVAHDRAVLVNRGLDVSMKDGLAGAFKFERNDGVKIRLAHEPIFREGTKPIRTWMTTQIPDIVLTATFPSGEEFYWLFDAKYRIETNDESDQDLVQSDAINQMHRYRDALIYQHDSGMQQAAKSRPVFGAYVLYPGFYNQVEEVNPYQKAIEEISIGAFSLLPSADGSGSQWLHNFLAEKLGASADYDLGKRAESYFIEEAARIPYKGTNVSHYDDLTVVFSGKVQGRSADYINLQRGGNLGCYHTRVLATDRQKIEQHIIKEVRYLSVAIDHGANEQVIKYIYPVNGVKLLKRSELSESQAGTSVCNNPEEEYWLFELGKSINVSNPLVRNSPEHFEVLLTGLEALRSSVQWDDLPQRYTQLTHN